MLKRIGFACKYKAIEENKTKKEIKEEEMNYNTKTTTLKFLSTKSENEIVEKMDSIIDHNLASTFRLLEYVTTLDKQLHMLRLTSDLLPFYTTEELKFYYKDKTIINKIESGLWAIGQFAREKDIRLSFHPGQFCVLASDNKNVIKNSIEEFEYHVDMIKMMGFAKNFQDMKCNIHISGRGGVSQFRKTFDKLSDEAKKVLTVENAEFAYGLRDCLEVADLCPIVFDIHHNWIHEEHFMSVNNDLLINPILDSWRGVRPTMHYSQSKEILFDVKQNENKFLNISDLLMSGFNKKMLAAHSDMMWNKPFNKEIVHYLEHFDIMVEAKNKNLASIDLLNQIKNDLKK